MAVSAAGAAAAVLSLPPYLRSQTAPAADVELPDSWGEKIDRGSGGEEERNQKEMREKKSGRKEGKTKNIEYVKTIVIGIAASNVELEPVRARGY